MISTGSTGSAYPVRVDATLDAPLSRWLWLVKWFLLIPHAIVLVFLWIAFSVLSIVAFFAILFTGRYPPSIFAFNVGVLRWSWRVSYYAYGALGTDRYPPFTLDDDPGYPAHFEVAYPEHLSRGLVLVKWWLLAIPHYIVVGLFVGGVRLAIRSETWSIVSGGLIGLLVLVAGVMLAFTARYPAGLYDLVIGLNRWVLRVAAYVSLMTDQYPPFKLDSGGADPGGTMTVAPPPPAPGPASVAASVPAAFPAAPPAGPPAAPSAVSAPAGYRSGWTGGRIAAVIVGAAILLASLGLFAGGGALLWVDRAGRDPSGFVTDGPVSFASGTYAITSGRMSWLAAPSWLEPASILGTVRFRVTATDPSVPVFVGVASSGEVDEYLRSVSRAFVGDFGAGEIDRSTIGERAPAAPGTQTFWAASVSGSGTQVLDWRPDEGTWTVLVMNADARPGVNVRAEAGATFPGLDALAAGLLIGGGVALIIGALLVFGAVVRSGRREPLPVPPSPPSI